MTRLQLNIKGNLYSLWYDDTSIHFTETPEGPLSRLYVKVQVENVLKEWVLHTVLQPTVLDCWIVAMRWYDAPGHTSCLSGHTSYLGSFATDQTGSLLSL